MTILITGAAGFIGFHISKSLLEEGTPVIGVDNFNNYYDPTLKLKRINLLKELSAKSKIPFSIINSDIKDLHTLRKIFEGENLNEKTTINNIPKIVIHLAAQAGVRYSIENPKEYIDTNIKGFHNIIDLSKEFEIEHFVYASSSSVYGGNTCLPFKETMSVEHPVSLYGATKKANELIAHSYSNLFKLPTTGLRFFTVYGPYGRPDMALFLFTKSIIENKEINIFNQGKMTRDFTYIDDLVKCVLRIIKKPPKANKFFDKKSPDPSQSWAPYRIFNIGNSQPVNLMEYIEELEKNIGKKAIKKFLPMQLGDVEATASDVSLLKEYIGFSPDTSIKKGISEFVKWYKGYYKN